MRLAFHGWLVVSSLVVSLLGGCSVTVVESGNGSGGSGGGAGGSGGMGGGSGGGGGCGADSCGGQGGSSSTGVGGMGGGVACGGFAGFTCGPDEWCDYPNDRCGDTDAVGTCLPRPEACPDIYSPTCACDGKVYGNACDAAGAGSDISNLGNCAPPSPAMFACGHGFCDDATQYCQKTTSDVGGFPDFYQCLSLPAACGATPSCACLDDPCVSISCENVADGSILVTCPGG